MADGDNFVIDGFTAGSLRGTDAAGIASIEYLKKKVYYTKLPISGPMFVTDKYAHQLAYRADVANMMTIAHTRAASSGTAGGVSEAHPFHVESEDGSRQIIGVHNGTLTGWSHKPGAKQHTVDSEWALYHIFNKGLEAFKDFNGAYCFNWWDSADNKVMNFALNNERHMYVAFTESGGMAYASELGMLWWLMERRGIKIKGKARKLMPHFWYKFDVSKLESYTKVGISRGFVSSTTTTYSTNMSSVTALLEKISNTDDSLAIMTVPMLPATPAPVASSVALVTNGEVKLAQETQLYHVRGEFYPKEYNVGTRALSGKWVTMAHDGKISQEYPAIIRNAALFNWNSTTSKWACTCLGVSDDNEAGIVVLSHPSMALLGPPLHNRVATTTH